MLPPDNLEPNSEHTIVEVETASGINMSLPPKLQEFASKSERNQNLLVLLCELTQKRFHKMNMNEPTDDGDLNYLIHVCRIIEASEPGIKMHLIDFLVNLPNLSLQQATLRNELLYTWIDQAEEELSNLRSPKKIPEQIGVVNSIKKRISDVLCRIHSITRINHA